MQTQKLRRGSITNLAQIRVLNTRPKSKRKKEREKQEQKEKTQTKIQCDTVKLIRKLKVYHHNHQNHHRHWVLTYGLSEY